VYNSVILANVSSTYKGAFIKEQNKKIEQNYFEHFCYILTFVYKYIILKKIDESIIHTQLKLMYKSRLRFLITENLNDLSFVVDGLTEIRRNKI